MKNILPRICLGHFMKCFVSQLHCHTHSLSLWDPPSGSFAVCQQLWFSFTPGASHIPVSHWTCFKLHPPTCPVSYSESRFVVFLAWSSQRMLKAKTKTNTHPHSLWSSPLFLWDLGSGCYDCLHFFLCLPGCLHLFPVSTYLSSMYTINVTHCCMEDKNSPGMSTCRADELFPAPIYSSGCMATSWFNPRHSVPVLSFSQEMIITFAPHFTLFTKLLNDISPQNHCKPLALDGVHLYLLSPVVYGIAVSFQSA